MFENIPNESDRWKRGVMATFFRTWQVLIVDIILCYSNLKILWLSRHSCKIASYFITFLFSSISLHTFYDKWQPWYSWLYCNVVQKLIPQNIQIEFCSFSKFEFAFGIIHVLTILLFTFSYIHSFTYFFNIHVLGDFYVYFKINRVLQLK